MSRPLFVGVAMVLAVTGIAARLHTDPAHVKPPHTGRPVAVTTNLPPSGDWVGDTTDIAVTVAWIDQEEQRERETLAAEAERLATTRAAANVAVARPRTEPTPTGSVGDCTGFAIPDHIIVRESGGNPWAVNSASGAFGCGQVMPMHWNGGGCSDLDQWTIDGQRECVDRLSSGGTNLNPWSATR
jgi:hypothetical protein